MGSAWPGAAAALAQHPAVRELARWAGWPQLDGGVLIIACSGGADSTALLAACALLLRLPRFGKRFSAAPTLLCWHLDHELRAESAGDAQHVRALCADLCVDCTIERADIAALAALRGQNIEACGRQERYARLEAFASAAAARRGADPAQVAVFTAQHLNDQAETVLHHVIRGAELAGLRGIAEQRGIFRRPWLGLPRAVLQDFLSASGLQHVEDASNRDSCRTRARLRHEILPQLEALAPGAAANLAGLAQSAKLARRLLQAEFERSAVSVHALGDILRWLPLLGWPAADYQLLRLPAGLSGPFVLELAARQALERAGRALARDERRALARWSRQPAERLKLRGYELQQLTRSLLGLSPSPHSAPSETATASVAPGDNVSVAGLSATLGPADSGMLAAHRRRRRQPWENMRRFGPALEALIETEDFRQSWDCYLPAETPLPLRLRAARPGERIRLAADRSKLLSDVFIDAGLPALFRPLWCVLADAGDEALWLPGLADGALLRGTGEEWLLLRLREQEA